MKVKRAHILLVTLIFLLICIILGFNRETVVYPDECVGCKKFPEEFTDDTFFKDEYDTFLEAYYTNLTKNIGYNAKGSCGYVALGMLLSYYATYQSASIIEEKYICPSESYSLNMNSRHNSPGIYNDDVNADMDDWSNEDYYQYMYEYANDDFQPSFHAKLLTIGYDLGYYGQLNSSQPGTANGSMLTDVLKKYLSGINFVENTNYTITTKSSLLFGSSNIRDFVKENIQKGKPVLIGINNGVFSEGHFCIAYDYDEKEDEIYANFGWGLYGGHQHTRVRNACSNYFFALTIDFKMPHTHTKYYGVERIENGKLVVDYYCWDDCRIITSSSKNITHNYTDHYEMGNSSIHYLYCKCGDYITEEHNYTEHYDIELSEHTGYCACGASKVELHNYIDHYEKADSDTYHYAYCECGEKIDEKHYWNKDPDYSGIGSVVRCKYCLFSKRLKHGEFTPIVIGRREEEYEES